MEKLHCSLSTIMNNKQSTRLWIVKVSTNDLRSIFVGHIHFKKLMKFRKFIQMFHCWLTRLRNKKLGFFYSYLMIRNTIRKENMGQRSFKKRFKFHNLSEIFYPDMTKLRNTNLSVFLQCQESFEETKILDRVCLKNI